MERSNKPNPELEPDRWLAFCILIGKLLLTGALWLNWLALTWCFLFRVIEVNLATGLMWFLLLALPVIAGNW